MSDVAILLAKGWPAGHSWWRSPAWRKAFARGASPGLFSAAPAVAIAGLSITVLDKGAHAAHESAIGMLAGGECRHDRRCTLCPMAARSA